MSPAPMRAPLVMCISTPGLVNLLVDTDCMCLWECLRVARRATAGRLAGLVSRPREHVQDDLQRMAAAGLVIRRPKVSSTGGETWSVAGEPIVVSVPKSSAARHQASIDRIRKHHLRHFEDVALRFGVQGGDPLHTLRVDERRLAHVRPDDVQELRRRMRSVFDYLELVASRKAGPRGNRLACNHAISIEVRPIEGPALPLPSRIRLHGPDDAARAIEHASPAEIAPALTPGEAPRKRTLSRRELQVAEALAGGLTRKELAQALGLSTNTVATLLKRVYAKLGVHRRAELATVMANNHRA